MKSLKYRKWLERKERDKLYKSIHRDLNKKYTNKDIKSFINSNKSSGYNKKQRRYVIKKDEPYDRIKQVKNTTDVIINALSTIRGSEKQIKNYNRYQQIQTAREIIKSDVDLVKDLQKFKNMNKEKILKLSPKQFREYSLFKAKLSKALVKVGVITIKEKFKVLGSKSKWQLLIDELEELLIETAK